jgi:hypothetical protein
MVSDIIMKLDCRKLFFGKMARKSKEEESSKRRSSANRGRQIETVDMNSPANMVDYPYV